MAGPGEGLGRAGPPCFQTKLRPLSPLSQGVDDPPPPPPPPVWIRHCYPNGKRSIFQKLHVILSCTQVNIFLVNMVEPYYCKVLRFLIIIFYYIDTSVLLENIPLVTFIKNYIRDPSGLFSIISHVSLLMT